MASRQPRWLRNDLELARQRVDGDRGGLQKLGGKNHAEQDARPEGSNAGPSRRVGLSLWLSVQSANSSSTRSTESRARIVLQRAFPLPVPRRLRRRAGSLRFEVPGFRKSAASHFTPPVTTTTRYQQPNPSFCQTSVPPKKSWAQLIRRIYQVEYPGLNRPSEA